MRKRFDIKAILRDPAKRRLLIALVIQATQQREGKDTTFEQACAAYDRVMSGLPRSMQKRWGDAVISVWYGNNSNGGESNVSENVSNL